MGKIFLPGHPVQGPGQRVAPAAHPAQALFQPGDVRGGETVAKLGHDYIETEAEIPPSYEADGKTAVYTCSRCGDVCGGELIPKYVLTPGSGDADLDGKVTVKDALHALRILVNSLAYSETADADLNGRITLSDVLRILKRAAEGT